MKAKYYAVIFASLFGLVYASEMANTAKLHTTKSSLCSLIGECLPCELSDMTELYCKATGHRQELVCSQNGINSTVFETCTLVSTTYQGFHDVLMFEAVMLLSLIFGSHALRSAKNKHLSSFDLRKDPKQPSKPFQI